jgi:hypothetical protein
MSFKFVSWKRPMAATAKMAIPTSAIAVIANITFSASPTPAR